MNERTRKLLLKLVADNYSAIAANFSATRDKVLWPELKQQVSNICEELQGRKAANDQSLKILDAGCGNGRLLSALPEYCDYYGIDNCPELISLAQDKHQQQHFSVCDVLNLNFFKENNFDLVACVAVLQHLPSYQLRLEAVKQLKSKLSPNGKLIIANWNLYKDKKGQKLIFKYALLKLFKKHDMDYGDIIFNWQNNKLPGSERYYHAFSKSELKTLIKDAGLKLISLNKDKFNYYLIAQK